MKTKPIGNTVMTTETTEKTFNTLDDIFNDDFFISLTADDEYDPSGIIMSEERQKEFYGSRQNSAARNGYDKGENEITARQSVCKDFAKYQILLDNAEREMNNKGYSRSTIAESDIRVGHIFVSKGLLGVVVAINDSEHRNSGQDKRAHMVYANATESHLLLSSVISNTYKDNSYFVKINE